MSDRIAGDLSAKVQPLSLYAMDGVRIDAGYTPGAGELCVVLAHGFTGNRRQPSTRRIAARLNRVGGVIAIDLRGHGWSGGLSTLGDREILDVDAAVRHARHLGYERVALVGFSLGGVVVVRHAALLGGVDAVVAVSAPSRWHYRDTTPMRRVATSTPICRSSTLSCCTNRRPSRGSCGSRRDTATPKAPRRLG